MDEMELKRFKSSKELQQEEYKLNIYLKRCGYRAAELLEYYNEQSAAENSFGDKENDI